MDYNVSVRDTVVVNATQEYHGCLGVWGGYMRQFHFEHNDICRVAYGGLSLGWGWAIPVAQTYQRENDIGYNRISHWLRVLEDSGGKRARFRQHRITVTITHLPGYPPSSKSPCYIDHDGID